MATWIEDLPELLTSLTLRNTLGITLDEDLFESYATLENGFGEKCMSRESLSENFNLGKGDIFFQNLQHFKKARKALDVAANAMPGMKEIEEDFLASPIDKVKDENGRFLTFCRQQNILGEGNVAKNIEELYEVAELALPKLETLLKTSCYKAGIDQFTLAPLKSKSRASEKASDDYGKRQPGPDISWLYDIVRGKVVCNTGDEVLAFLSALTQGSEILRLKNRCKNSLFNGYRDLLINLRLPIDESLSHICEVQIHLEPIVAVTKTIDSHLAYEFFRSYFKGNQEAVQMRLETLLSLPDGTEAEAGALEYASMEDVLEAVIQKPDTTIEMLVNYAQLMKEIGGADTAPLRKRCLEARLEAAKRSGNGPSMVMAMNDLATCLHDEGNIEGAKKLMEYVLNVSEQLGGPMHPRTMTALGNLASFLFLQKDFDGAEPLMRLCIKRYSKAIGPSHPRTIAAVNNLAMLQKSKGDLISATKTFGQCLEGFVSALGENHPNVARIRGNLGELYLKQDKLEEADLEFTKSQLIFERTLGPNHPETAVARKNQALVLARKEMWEEAISAMARVVRDLSAGLGGSHPVTQTACGIEAAYQKHELEPANDLL